MEPAHIFPKCPALGRVIYVAGRMTGIEGYNYPAFFAASRTLSQLGWEVVNPAANFYGRVDLPWDVYLRQALRDVTSCSDVYFMSGWSLSKGARLEHRVAEDLGLTLHYQVPAEAPTLKLAHIPEDVAHG